MEILGELLPYFTHEYELVVYGVILWEVFLGKKEEKLQHAIRGMGFGGAIIAFDDELLARFNHYAIIDFEHWPWYLYIVAGFGLNLVISKYLFKDKEKQ